MLTVCLDFLPPVQDSYFWVLSTHPLKHPQLSTFCLNHNWSLQYLLDSTVFWLGQTPAVSQITFPVPAAAVVAAAAAAAKSLQSCPTLCDPIDGNPPGSPVSGILQARTLQWVAIPSPLHESEK